MCTLKTLRPGQKGTKELLTRLGQSLLCVRYRDAEARREHLKTAGGRWDPDRRVWMLRRDAVERLDLRDRVVGGGG